MYNNFQYMEFQIHVPRSLFPVSCSLFPEIQNSKKNRDAMQ